MEMSKAENCLWGGTEPQAAPPSPGANRQQGVVQTCALQNRGAEDDDVKDPFFKQNSSHLSLILV